MSARRLPPLERVDGDVTVPGDKSISHRVLILGALARGRSYAGNLSAAADVAATAACLRECGAWIRQFGPRKVALEGSGAGRSLETPSRMLDCGNSGTTMRLLAGALSGHECSATLDGDDSLRRRPMLRIAEPLRAMGADVQASSAGTAPLEVRGRSALAAVTWTMPVASAQVKSAVLLAGLSATGPTAVVEPHPTRDHTERLLRLCGVAVASEGDRVTVTPADPEPFGIEIPGDVSAAAFLLCLAAARPGWRTRCQRVGLNPGRTGFLDVLLAMGASVEVDHDEPAGGVEPQGAIVVRGAPLHGVTIAGELTVRCIDEVPAIAVLATQAEGTTHIRDAGELRTKESDRIAGVVQGLRAFGASCEATEDGLVIDGPAPLRAAAVDSGGDHRLAMAWSIAASLTATGSGASRIDGADAVAVSFPAFFEELGRAGSGDQSSPA